MQYLNQETQQFFSIVSTCHLLLLIFYFSSHAHYLPAIILLVTLLYLLISTKSHIIEKETNAFALKSSPQSPWVPTLVIVSSFLCRTQCCLRRWCGPPIMLELPFVLYLRCQIFLAWFHNNFKIRSEKGNSVLDMLNWGIAVDHSSEVQGRDNGHGWRCLFRGCRS